MDTDCHLFSAMINGTVMQVYDISTLTLQGTNSFTLISNYSLLDLTQSRLILCL
jgi:hypothetical protein